jgi:diacylglycerol O-acyltransferase
MRLPEGYQGDFYENVKATMAGRLHLADVFTRKLALMPFDLSNPVWVEDDDVDLDYHIRHITLPQPGTNRQLQQYVARLHSSLLDRSRPMWEFYIIDGLKSGEVALYFKVHHAGIDGQAGVALGKAIFDTTPAGRVIRPPREKSRRSGYQLGVAELATAAFRNTVVQYDKMFKMLPELGKVLQSMATDAVANLSAAQSVTQKLPSSNNPREWAKSLDMTAPRTPFNVAITNQRSFAGRTFSLAETKAIAKHFGVTLNDVVMSVCAAGLRGYLKSTDELPAKPLIAGVPVSLREAGDETSNNQVSMILVSLATDIADPLERLKVIHESSAQGKTTMNRFRSVILDDFPSFGAPWLLSGIASFAGRSGLANVMPPVANVVISNVPTMQQPMYFAGAEMISYYPVSIAAQGMALNMTVQSYNGRLDYGLIACRRTVPDADILEIGDYMLEEHKKLLALMQTVPAAPAPEKKASKGVSVPAVAAVAVAAEPRPAPAPELAPVPAKKAAAPRKAPAKKAAVKKSKTS